MTKDEIKYLIKSNETDRLNLLLSSILNKSKAIHKQLNVLSIAMLILILIFYLGKLKVNGDMQLGPLKIDDISVLSFLIPLIFSFIILRFVILSSHSAEIKKLLKVFASEYFMYSNNIDDKLFTDDLTRLMLPVSIYDEIGKFNYKTRTGCFSVLLTFPMIFVAIAPYVFIGLWIIPQLLTFKTLDIFNQVSIILTIWIVLISVFYFIKTIIVELKENK